MALLLLLALLFDLRMPRGGSPGFGERWVLLDASLSMTAGEDGDDTWRTAIRRAESLEEAGWRVLTFGAEVHAPEDLSGVEPRESASRLAPALTAAAESGAREIRVLSDLRFDDAVAVRATLDALPARTRFEALGGAVRNAGVVSLNVMDRPEPTREGTARVEVHGGSPGGELEVEILEEGVPVASVRVEAPGDGLRRTVDTPLPPAGRAGSVRFEARLVGSDDFAWDDRALDYARVGQPADAGLVLVSFSPDWEPRGLLPVLERATGLPTTGYLLVGGGQYAPMGLALDRGPPVDSTTVREALEGATLVVLHGLSADTPDWAVPLLTRLPRLLAFAVDPAGAALLGSAVSTPRSGEWTLSEDLPASPLSGELSGLAGLDLPPLSGLMVPESPAGWVAPLQVRLRGTGPSEAPLQLRAETGRRAVLAVARGFWRWAARPGGRDAYVALWSAVGGWLLREPTAAGAEVRLREQVVSRGERPAWVVPVHRAGSRVEVRRETGPDELRVVGTTELDASGTVFGEALNVGTYRYVVRSENGDSLTAGRFDVSSASLELLPQPVDPDGLRSGAADPAASSRVGRPLRTSPWPYLLIIGLLCAEWTLRRRTGLR